MHELGLVLSALDMAAAHARRAGASRIHRMRLRVGAQSGVVVEALELAFSVAKPGTLAEGAELDIERTPVVCHCQRCACDFEPVGAIYCCPICDIVSSQVLQGRELELESLEVS
jgi:hydrogenase nickel incorporation protein HypA/HybF